jgi:alanyl-tRNA synthetase
VGVTGERLYYTDSYVKEFRAQVLAADGEGKRICLDRTAFYPTSGGQPHDTGTLNGVPVVDVVDEEDRIVHLLGAPLEATEVAGLIDWVRRFDYMQQHTGQHLLSAVLEEMFHFSTVSVHFGATGSTLDIQAASLAPALMEQAEIKANEIVLENRPVTVSFEPSDQIEGLRKTSGRSGELRILTIEGLDRSACGGTHVRATGEIGPILIRGLDKIRGNVRIEFLCGHRALRRARADYDALNRVARVFSAPLDDVPGLVVAQAGQLKEAERTRRRLGMELATRRGLELHSAAEPRTNGRRVHIERIAAGPFDDELRTLAQSFTSQPNALFLAIAQEPPSLLYAVSSDSGIHAGNRLKEFLTSAGGRGGGNAQLGQGSVPSAAALDAAVKSLVD